MNSIKQAHQIAAQHADIASAAAAAEAAAFAKDQIWSGEGYTIYGFSDNSFLSQSGSEQIAVDADDRDSVLAYVEWLGDDADLDKQRVGDMLDALAQ